MRISRQGMGLRLLQTIQQSLDKVVPPDTSMVCEADNFLLYDENMLEHISCTLIPQ